MLFVINKKTYALSNIGYLVTFIRNLAYHVFIV